MLGVFILCRAAGNLSLAWGTKHLPQHLSIDPLAYLYALFSPFVSAGVVLLALSMLTRVALFSVADLSYILPVTAVGYVISAILGVLFLGERVTPAAWLGTLLIFAGAAVVTSTPRMTSHQSSRS